MQYVIVIDMKLYTILFIIFLTSYFGSAYADQDLEEYVADFVLETRQLTIPDYPYAFNPSIVRWHGKLFMSFRDISNPNNTVCCSSSVESYIYMVELDDNFRLLGSPQNLRLGPRAEDARLVTVNDHLYIIYSDNKDEAPGEGGYRVCVAELQHEGESFYIIHNETLSHFEGESLYRREKNWVPFNYEGYLLLAYGLNPHKILYPLLNGTGKCETYVSSIPSIVWEWGELRGGTPGLLVDNKFYLAFFHSSIQLATVQSGGKKISHYFMGAYTFSRDPLFEIERVSPEPIIGNNFYNGIMYDPYWKPVRVVFPCGFIVDQDFLWVSYGRQDHEIWLAKLDKKGLLDSLIQVSTIQP